MPSNVSGRVTCTIVPARVDGALHYDLLCSPLEASVASSTT